MPLLLVLGMLDVLMVLVVLKELVVFVTTDTTVKTIKISQYVSFCNKTKNMVTQLIWNIFYFTLSWIQCKRKCLKNKSRITEKLR